MRNCGRFVDELSVIKQQDMFTETIECLQCGKNEAELRRVCEACD